MKVLIHGLNGVGVEAAKNLLLAGPHTVTLHDEKVCEIQDLGANFYLTEADVEAGASDGQAKAAAAVMGDSAGEGGGGAAGGSAAAAGGSSSSSLISSRSRAQLS